MGSGQATQTSCFKVLFICSDYRCNTSAVLLGTVPPVFSGLHGYSACLKQALLFYTNQGLRFGGLHASVTGMGLAQQFLFADQC